MKMENKMDWSQVYIAETPAEYIQFSLGNQYVVPEYSINYIKPLLKKLRKEFNRPPVIMDLGASYGIISTLILKDISWQELIDFYTQSDLSPNKVEAFYKDQPYRKDYDFYLLDSSEPAMRFSESKEICKKAFVFNLKNGELSKELKELVKEIDVFISVASYGYFRQPFYRQIFNLIKESKKSPLFVISTYPFFDHEILEKEFKPLLQEHNYAIEVCRNPGIGRRMSSEEHTFVLKKGHYKKYPICQFEEEGFYTNAFYLAMHNNEKERYNIWLNEMDSLLEESKLL